MSAPRFRLPEIACWFAAVWIVIHGLGRLPGEDDVAPPDVPEEQGAGYLFDGYDPYLEMLGAEHIPQGGSKEMVRLKFDVLPAVPADCVISLTLEHGMLDFLSTDFTVKADARQGVVLDWIPERRLAEGEYFVRSRIHLEKQPPAVRAAIEQDSVRFPPTVQPWPYLYMTEELRITVASPLSDPAEQKRLWKAYLGYIADLTSRMDEFEAKMQGALQGQDFVVGDKLDVEKFRSYVLGWRASQDALRKSISEFQVREPALFVSSRLAFLALRDLERMVTRRARDLFKEVEGRYKQAVFDRKNRWMARDYPLRVDAETLAKQREKILLLIGYTGESRPPEGDGATPPAGQGAAAPDALPGAPPAPDAPAPVSPATGKEG